MSTPEQTQALVTHLLNQTLSTISTLESLRVISQADAHAIRAKLPSPTGPFPSFDRGTSPAPAHGTQFGGLNVPGGPSAPVPPYTSQPSAPPALPPRAPVEQRARALWDYGGTVSLRRKFQMTLTFQEADDLAFRAGDTLIVDEEGQSKAKWSIPYDSYQSMRNGAVEELFHRASSTHWNVQGCFHQITWRRCQSCSPRTRLVPQLTTAPTIRELQMDHRSPAPLRFKLPVKTINHRRARLRKWSHISRRARHNTTPKNSNMHRPQHSR